MEILSISLLTKKQSKMKTLLEIRNNLYNKANNWKERGFLNKYEFVKNEANKMKFQFDKKEVSIQYGKCIKFNKDVTFIPGICQLNTRECFMHRDNFKNNLL